MRFRTLALAGAAALASLAAHGPARAGSTDFFLDEHRRYFERDDAAAPAPAPPSRATVRTVSATPSDADRDTRPMFDRGHMVPGADQDLEHRPLASAIPREIVAYEGTETPGTIVVSTQQRRLYYVLPDGQAIRYGVGVGRPGFEWSGGQTVTAKREWPDWTPPVAMLKRRPEIPRHMAGGLDNPLGARAMYLGRTEYRIHGSNEPDTIGQAVSSGCIRMTNEDVADLYEHVKVGTRVIVQP